MILIILVFMLLTLVFVVIIGTYLSGYYLVICQLFYLHNFMFLLGDVECLMDDVACSVSVFLGLCFVLSVS